MPAPEMPRVSVIVPAYNCAEFLPEAVRSVEAQASGDWEIVICDDASTDGTAEVAAGFGERVTLVRNKTNQGPAGARNTAMSAARGELLALLDADDYWLPNYLTDQVGLYDSSRADGGVVGVVACNARILGPDGFAPETFMDSLPWPARPSLAKLLVANTIYGSFMVPRAIAEEVGGFSLECYGTEDHDLCVKVLERGYGAVANPEPVAVYRLQEGSVSSNFARMARNTQTVQRLALERGHLGWRERWIARRELRAGRLVEDAFEIREERASSGRLPVGRVVRAVPRAILVGLQNPRRCLRVLRRLAFGKGSLGQRLNPGREDNLLQS